MEELKRSEIYDDEIVIRRGREALRRLEAIWKSTGQIG
ncbi:MAG: hypothetical protein MASP_01269 [Candidatus Methanolliviera sp. GoM_asphalt]|nr:MAG: hypothetical protein MASP_01269 [Candidatus Methanolliviera sp. GoM_asphalt]